jgi:biotin synthase
MNFNIQILNQQSFSKTDIITLLSLNGSNQQLLIDKARQVADDHIGKRIYFRGLIEYSNICAKNCYYCGIRKDNRDQHRYTMEDQEVLDCAQFAFEQNYGSIVIQTGERSDEAFVNKIEYLIKEIKKLSSGNLGITLSLGEQSFGSYQRWFSAGAHRYLLRIEASNRELYAQIHPDDEMHSFDNRLEALNLIKKAGYQLGTGVMIGLPGQTIEDLANDILFFKYLDIDMVGMGPFIEHEHTPMYKDKNNLLSLQQRFDLALNMVATLRLVMPDINMAATTAMQTIDPAGREKAILSGANIVMPNITPVKYKECYKLYDGKPCIEDDAYTTTESLVQKINSIGFEVILGKWGDSNHFLNKKSL